MDVQALAFPDAFFDCVLVHLVLAVVPDPLACTLEVSRVLAPTGRISIFDKFLPDEAVPSPSRRALNLVTTTLFSDINRQLGPLLAPAGLIREHEEAALWGGAYWIVLARKWSPR
jgi:ubiquinone/menaquinone biosynthesis C-methylase UbiE